MLSVSFRAIVYNGENWRIFYSLQGDRYLETEVNLTFPEVPKIKLHVFLAKARLDEMAADRLLRE